MAGLSQFLLIDLFPYYGSIFFFLLLSMPDNLQWMSVTVNFTLLGRYFCIPTDILELRSEVRLRYSGAISSYGLCFYDLLGGS